MKHPILSQKCSSQLQRLCSITWLHPLPFSSFSTIPQSYVCTLLSFSLVRKMSLWLKTFLIFKTGQQQ